MKKILLTLFVLLLLPSIFAVDLEINKTSSEEVMVLDLNIPTTFDLKIKNNGSTDFFTFYTFFGILDEPKGKVQINKGETKDIQLKILPSYTLNPGFSTFNVFVRGSDDTETSVKLVVKITDLQNSFIVTTDAIDPESDSINIYFENKFNFKFENMNVKFSSVFFDFEESFSLSPNEKKTFEIKLDKEKFKEVTAGFYTLRANIQAYEKEIEIEGTIKFSEKDILTVSKQEYGIIVYTKIIEKTNEGNVIQSSETVIKKNIISRLFTNLDPEPDLVERQGFSIYYSWIREIGPGETLTIRVKTNWMFPFLIIFLIVAVVVFVKQYLKTDLSLRKKVSFVRAKGGEFALKVSIIVHSKRYIEKVNIIDRLPGLVKVYEKFGREIPSRVDEEKRRIEWNFEKLESGEIRVISYIIYSKVGIIGKFALPSTTAIYEKNGKIHETQSNMAFFMAEQKTKDDDED